MPISCLSMAQTDPLQALFTRAKQNGVPMAVICRHAGVAPTTPSRWKHGRNGANVESIRKLSAALDALLADAQGIALPEAPGSADDFPPTSEVA